MCYNKTNLAFETKMNFNNNPKARTLGFIALAALALIVIVVAQPGSLSFRNKTDYDALRRQAELENQQYADLLAYVEPDYEASQQFLKKIATEDLVREQVETSLQTKQQINIPAIADSEIKFTPRSDRDTVVNYLNDVGSMVDNYSKQINPKISTLFADSGDVVSPQNAKRDTEVFVQNLRGLPVPSEMAAMHKANIVAFEEYGNMFATASDYAAALDSEPWDDVYGDYAVINNRMSVTKTELEKVRAKYAITDQEIPVAWQGFFIKTAQAQWLVVDVEQLAWEAVKAGLAKAFSQFAVKMIDKLVAHIDKTFAIASQLYYSQDLGRFYSIEYMQKFVDDPLDQDIIKQFLPEYFCVPKNKEELSNIFNAKAAENRGTDIVIDPADPQFLQKLARLGGDEKNYPGWWEGYYEDLASRTQQEAQTAATKEVTSPGLKTGRSLITNQIDKTMSTILGVQESAIKGTFDLGTNNTENFVGSLIATVVESMVNKFVFTPLGGGEGGSVGGLGVVSESNVCLRTPKINPVVPVPQSGPGTPTTSTPATPPTTQPTGTPPFNPR